MYKPCLRHHRQMARVSRMSKFLVVSSCILIGRNFGFSRRSSPDRFPIISAKRCYFRYPMRCRPAGHSPSRATNISSFSPPSLRFQAVPLLSNSPRFLKR